MSMIQTNWVDIEKCIQFGSYEKIYTNKSILMNMHQIVDIEKSIPMGSQWQIYTYGSIWMNLHWPIKIYTSVLKNIPWQDNIIKVHILFLKKMNFGLFYTYGVQVLFLWLSTM